MGAAHGADFEAEVESEAVDEGEDACGAHAASDARQLTRVSGGNGGAGLVITSAGSAGGSAGGESNEDDDFESESFRGRARVSTCRRAARPARARATRSRS